MERPERPSRHKSNPLTKFRANLSSDSDSELNDNDAPIQMLMFYDQHPPESASVPGGPSTSTATQQSQENTETPNNLMSLTPPLATVPREEEPPQPEVRRKRCGATLAVSSAGSVIFDGVDNQIDSSSVTNIRDSPMLERFQHSDYVIRPRSFCNIECSNAIRPPVYKLKRPNAPIDLTPNPTNRDTTCQAPVVTSSFSLVDNPSLPSNAESSTSYLHRMPYMVPQRSPQRNLPSTSSSILRHFDEMCSSSSSANPVYRRRNRGATLNVRFHDSIRGNDGSHSETAGTSTNRETSRNRSSSSLDDYCDLVGNFLFHCPSPQNNTDNQRSTPLAERTSEDFSSTALPSLPDLIRERNSTLNDFTFITSYNTSSPLTVPEVSTIRQVVEMAESMEQSNDDVIVVETPERPTLSSSPDSYVVPSSRSPTPQPPQPPVSQPKRDKPQANSVPMTLQELNQTLVSLLECPVCLDHATPPIFQCCKGHIVCQNCHPPPYHLPHLSLTTTRGQEQCNGEGGREVDVSLQEHSDWVHHDAKAG
ncbi:uncharacterized protein LOC124357374 [Homalodisca vitripennis]|uniref:uncharacterized protein LOC124357374 n=1 Tax=Homalodisca vitripennis TaxID=197043 RepID=UPI001EEB2026|nr:uncharacterized protein LOC124357374 [Homalodisca vitripennis]XP_046665068.1 uncharacterized protein LOC124357374 [Homalodisca vitripennis]